MALQHDKYVWYNKVQHGKVNAQAWPSVFHKYECDQAKKSLKVKRIKLDQLKKQQVRFLAV